MDSYSRRKRQHDADVVLVTEALNTLAEDCSAVLDASGVTGERGDCSRCPVAAYVAAFLGRHSIDDVELDVGEFNGVLVSSQGLSTFLALPQEVREFIEDFDNGAYPELCS